MGKTTRIFRGLYTGVVSLGGAFLWPGGLDLLLPLLINEQQQDGAIGSEKESPRNKSLQEKRLELEGLQVAVHDDDG